MKNIFRTRTFIVTTASIIILAFGIFLFARVGQAPSVGDLALLPTTTTQTNEPAYVKGDTINLAFPKGGRVDTVSVKNGQSVKKGDTLATLSAQDAQGAVTQAKAALDLATAKYQSLTLELQNAKKQQDVIVQNAYRTMLSSNLQATASQDDGALPIITGTYTCDKEGVYIIKPYLSNNSGTNYSFHLSGLETDVQGVEYNSTSPLGSCGLFVRFTPGFSVTTTWTIAIPNQKSASYITNKNAYDLAVATREKIISELKESIEKGNAQTSIARAQIDAALGAYQTALGVYQNNVIIAPIDGTVTFVGTDLKPGQSVAMNKTVISIQVQ